MNREDKGIVYTGLMHGVLIALMLEIVRIFIDPQLSLTALFCSALLVSLMHVIVELE